MRIFDKKNEPLAIKNGKKVIRSIHYKLGLQEVDDLLASCPEADERLPLSLYDQLYVLSKVLLSLVYVLI